MFASAEAPPDPPFGCPPVLSPLGAPLVPPLVVVVTSDGSAAPPSEQDAKIPIAAVVASRTAKIFAVFFIKASKCWLVIFSNRKYRIL